MTKQEEIFSKELIKDITILSTLRDKTTFYIDKTKHSFTNFYKKIDKAFLPLFKIIDSNDQFLYKIIYPQKRHVKSYSIQIFKTTEDQLSELFIEFFLHNLPKHVEDTTDNIQLDLKFFKLKGSHEELLKNNILLGKISQFLFFNQKSILLKINKYSTTYLHQIKSTYPKYTLFQNKLNIARIEHLNKQFPYFFEYLKEGISFNLKNELIPFEPPLSFSIYGSPELTNVIGIKLLESNKLLVTNLEDIDSPNETKHTISIKDPLDLQKPLSNLLFPKFFGYYKLPNIYAKVYENNKSLFQKHWSPLK